MFREVCMIVRPKPQIIIPNEEFLIDDWEWAKANFISKPTKWQKFRTYFVFSKELVHPVDHRIFHMKIVNGKVIKIGKYVYDTFKEAKDFDELSTWNSCCRYIK